MFNKNQTYEQHDNEKISFYESSVENLNSKDQLTTDIDIDVCVIGGGLTGIQISPDDEIADTLILASLIDAANSLSAFELTLLNVCILTADPFPSNLLVLINRAGAPKVFVYTLLP